LTRPILYEELSSTYYISNIIHNVCACVCLCTCTRKGERDAKEKTKSQEHKGVKNLAGKKTNFQQIVKQVK
jgi:hypothetical protein